MTNQTDIELIPLSLTSTPETMFDMVMLYADRTGKNAWKCFGEAFSSNNISLVFKNKNNDEFVGYCTVSIHDDGTLFFHHGLVLIKLDSVSDFMARIFHYVSSMVPGQLNRIELHSELPARLWHKWGFTESNVKIYERFMGGTDNGKQQQKQDNKQAGVIARAEEDMGIL